MPKSINFVSTVATWTRALQADRRGSVAITFGVASIPLVMFAGAAVDFGKAHLLKTKLQVAADAAVLAAAINPDASDEQAIRIAVANVLDSILLPESITASHSVAVTEDKIRVVVFGNSANTLTRIMSGPTTSVSASAVTAINATYPNPCILTLDNNAKESLLLNSDAKINAKGCQVQVNSTNPEGLRLNSDSVIDAGDICVAGGSVKDPSSTYNPQPRQCPKLDDPLAYLPEPAEATSACQWTDRTVTGTVTLTPGVYCKKLELNSDAKVTFSPGVYVIRDGEFIVNSGSAATGNGVMFYLTGQENNPRFNINSSSKVRFTAPTTGVYQGIVFFQARDAIADYSVLNSHSDSYIEGTIYLPNSGLKYNSFGSTTNTSPWMAVISKTFELNSNSVLNINWDYKNATVPMPKGLFNSGNKKVSTRLIE